MKLSRIGHLAVALERLKLTVSRYLTSLLLVFVGGFAASGFASGQTAGGSSFNQREFQAELLRLATICDKVGLAEQAELSRGWLAGERDDQTVLYLPCPFEDEETASAITVSWAKHFNAARSKFAATLFNEAERIVESDEQAAYRLVWRTLREDPTHAPARQVLGALARGVTSKSRVTRGRVQIPELGWQAGTYSLFETPHFRILSCANKPESLRLAQQLEEFYAIWSQVFFPLWAPPGLMRAKLTEQKGDWPKQRGIEVVLLENRAEYLKVLGVSEDRIGISVGYYNPGLHQSFFYPSPDINATLTHELTHQLLLEATHIDAQSGAGTENGIWLLEGVALYMESLTQHSSYWTLGGVDSPRLQTARYRGVRDGYWPDWKRFSSAGIDEWKKDHDLAKLYSHAAGLTHVMLDSLGAPSRARYIEALIGLYQGNTELHPRLLETLGQTEEQAKLNYQDTLVLKNRDVQALVDRRAQPRDLVLSGSQLSSAAWRMLDQFTELEWLDVSFSNAGNDDLRWLPNLHGLRRLSLEGTAVSGDMLEVVAQLPALQELDLSGCAIDDLTLRLLGKHSTIEILWLTQTSISGDALPILDSMPALMQCDVQGTQVSPSDWSAFVTQHPRLAP